MASPKPWKEEEDEEMVQQPFGRGGAHKGEVVARQPYKRGAARCREEEAGG